MKNNLLYVLAGVAIGVFGYTLFNQLVLGSLGGYREATPTRLDQSNDMVQLRRQLDMSQKRVTQLESLIGAASLANDRINRASRNKDQDVEKISNLKDLIDGAKPFLRELILPELEEAMDSGEFRSVATFMQWADELELSSGQRTKLQQQFEALSRQQAETVIDQIKDDETSMFSIFKQMDEYDLKMAPEIDAIYQSELNAEQFTKYQAKRFEQRTERVSDQADAKLNRLSNEVKDLTESQQDQIYALMARRSPYYSSDMEIEIKGQTTPVRDPIASDVELNDAISDVILPHQRDSWKKYQRRQTLLSGLGID